MVNVQPWCFFPLTLQILSSDYVALRTPKCPSLPVHINIIIAPLEVLLSFSYSQWFQYKKWRHNRSYTLGTNLHESPKSIRIFQSRPCKGQHVEHPEVLGYTWCRVHGKMMQAKAALTIMQQAQSLWDVHEYVDASLRSDSFVWNVNQVKCHMIYVPQYFQNKTWTSSFSMSGSLKSITFKTSGEMISKASTRKWADTQSQSKWLLKQGWIFCTDPPIHGRRRSHWWARWRQWRWVIRFDVSALYQRLTWGILSFASSSWVHPTYHILWGQHLIIEYLIIRSVQRPSHTAPGCPSRHVRCSEWAFWEQWLKTLGGQVTSCIAGVPEYKSIKVLLYCMARYKGRA